LQKKSVCWQKKKVKYNFFAMTEKDPPLSVQEKPGQGEVIGTLNRYDHFLSAYVTPRHVDVWLPPGYSKNSKERYSVLYMHDGQNLFNPLLSHRGIDWGIDEALTNLIQNQVVRPTIVVGIWNTPKRILEYMPQKPFDLVSSKENKEKWTQEINGTPISDRYLKFLTKELKPFVDYTYPTLSDRVHTSISGSSMGGLISLYAVCEFPQIFGGAASLSTHWPICDGITLEYMKSSLPKPGKNRFYFDYGTAEGYIEYESFQSRADNVMIENGYVRGKDWTTESFAGADHTEQSWRKRVHIPLKFLLED
jgi:predicted alpha/beta superfamily hydrolase